MQPVTKDQLYEFQNIISKTSLVTCNAAMPLLGMRWRDVSKAVRSQKLPMTSASVGLVLRGHFSNTSDYRHFEEILAMLRLHVVANNTSRIWHTIKLHEPMEEEQPVALLTQLLTDRVRRAARKHVTKYGARVEVYSAKSSELMFMSLRQVSRVGLRDLKLGTILYVATLPGEPLAFLSSLQPKNLLRAVVEGLGYTKHTDPKLHGPDITSLIKIIDRSWNVNVNNLTEMPEYAPCPVVTSNGIDYTNRAYNERYIDNIIGPEPPLLNDLVVKSEQMFFDPEFMNRTITINMTVKSENVAETLKSLVRNRSLHPASDMFKMFHQIKSNRVEYDGSDDE